MRHSPSFLITVTLATQSGRLSEIEPPRPTIGYPSVYYAPRKQEDWQGSGKRRKPRTK